MYIQAVSMADLDAKLRVAAKEAMDHGCTWSISKIFAGTPVNIVSSFEVVLDSSVVKSPKIDPDPSRVKKFVEIQPPTTT